MQHLSLTATVDGSAAYQDAVFTIIATPTNCDPAKNFFDTSSVESVINQVLACKDHGTIVIKSMVSVSYAESLHLR